MISNISYNIKTEEGVSIAFVYSLPQGSDIAIINSSKKGDIIIMYDQGLASIILSKSINVVSPYGKIFAEKILSIFQN